jgi:nitrogen-specific signal transduction histidine kinase/CheY-like chemotaxis protein
MNEPVSIHDSDKLSENDLRYSQSRKLEAIGRLAGGVAHDFNNHLTVILGCCQLLRKQHQEGTEPDDLLAEIEKAGERAATLTRQLLAFSRKQTIQLVPLSLNDIVTNLVTMLRRLISENISLKTDLGAPLRNIKADLGQVEQVIMNLAVNARDAMARGGGELRIETREITVGEIARQEDQGIPPGDYVTLVVRDSGCGMDSEVMAHLFEPFFTTKEPGKGTGLGLATVYGIVKQCNGHIRVASKKGVGTRFRIYFPAVADAVRKERAGRSGQFGELGRGTLLLVEDDPSLRKLAAHALRRGGYVVLEASHGQEALGVADHHRGSVDLVLTDVIMPFLNGPQMVDQLLVRYPGLKVVYMSGYTDSYLPFDEEEGAPPTLLHKPFTPSVLLETIQKALTTEG